MTVSLELNTIDLFQRQLVVNNLVNCWNGKLGGIDTVNLNRGLQLYKNTGHYPEIDPYPSATPIDKIYHPLIISDMRKTICL